MRRLFSGFILGVIGILLLAAGVSAHTPLLYIEDNEDGTIYVEAGFSDGSGTAGMPCRLEDKDGNVLWEGKFDEYSSLIIEKPNIAPYYVVFDGGPGHVVTKEGPPLTAAERGITEAPAEEVPVAAPEAPAQAMPGEAPAVTAPAPTVPVTQPTPSGPPGADTPAWTPGTTTTTSQAQGLNNTPLWVAVGLLGFIAVAVLLLCVGMFLYIGWTMGRKSRD